MPPRLKLTVGSSAARDVAGSCSRVKRRDLRADLGVWVSTGRTASSFEKGRSRKAHHTATTCAQKHVISHT